MSLDQARSTVSVRRYVILFACVLVLAITLTWAFLGMRSVMDVGGACADGGPYVSAQPCPDGTWMLALAFPVMVIVAMVGTAVAGSVSAPDLLLPMWGLLFGSLGWNFLEYGLFSGDLIWGWIICGVLFELMAAPVFLMALPRRGGREAVWTPPRPSDPAETFGAWWWPIYAVLGGLGLVLGAWSFSAWS